VKDTIKQVLENPVMTATIEHKAGFERGPPTIGKDHEI